MALFVTSFVGSAALALAAVLPVPPSVSSANGALDLELTLERATITTSSGVRMTTRAFNGMLPGPTIRVRPGDSLRVHFRNQLPDQGSAYLHNEFSAADESNVHFHGLYVSGELPSDDATVPVLPGEDRVYMTSLPSDHMPGTHWLHPHRHGSTALQVGGGAASAIIVEDAPGTLPAQVEGAPEVLLMVMQMDLAVLERIASRSQDSWFSVSGGTLTTLVNGEITPEIPANAGEWTRFRVVYAGWLAEELSFQITGCEMALLAKDGIYIRNFPRMLDGSASIAVGGRADIMVRCPAANSQYQVTWAGESLATVTTGAEVKPSTDLASWSPTFPAYLEDLQSSEASPGCACVTRLDRREVNGLAFEKGAILHQSYIGAVVQREVRARDHPYHQHVYPFQLISGFGSDQNDRDNRGNTASNYFQPGDWHDTIDGSGLLRYRPTRYTGKVMLHCHRLDHEDEGMMAMELVHDSGTCVCGAVPLEWWVLLVIILASCILTCLVAVIILCAFNRVRYGAWSLFCKNPGVSPV